MTIGFISEKGGVSKSTLAVSLIKKLNQQKNTFVINMDESSYSIYYLLKDANLLNVNYIDYNWMGLSKLLESKIIKEKFIFIDFKGEQITEQQLYSIQKNVNFFILPIVPSKSNLGAFDHSLSLFNKLPKGKTIVVFSLMNNVKPESDILKVFIEGVRKYKNIKSHSYYLLKVNNLEKEHKTLLNNKYNNNSIKELIKALKLF